MTARAPWAVVPVKSFSSAKHRLAGLLSAAERAGLARVMLGDVLRALRRSPRIGGTLVVTADAQAAAMARFAGAEVLPDQGSVGLVPALSDAARVLAEVGCPGMLVIPIDVPLISSGDVDQIVTAQAGGRCLTLVAAERDGGTNALACSPPAVLPLCYGKHSFRNHLQAARALGIATTVLKLPNLALDIDEPDDLMALIERPLCTGTQDFLASSGIAQRLLARRLPHRLPRLVRTAPVWPCNEGAVQT